MSLEVNNPTDAQSAGFSVSTTCLQHSGGTKYRCNSVTHKGLESPRVARQPTQNNDTIGPSINIAHKYSKHFSGVVEQPGQ